MLGRSAAIGLNQHAEGFAPLLSAVVKRLTPEVCGRVIAAADPEHQTYRSRLLVCVEYHAARFGENRPIPLVDVVERLERGDLGRTMIRANLLRDVVLAQALELGEPRAAQVFEDELMPAARSMARHLGGERAAQAVENFAAELLLPRPGREPRIATYQGRTALRHWLGAVVANSLRTELRRRGPSGPIGFDSDGLESTTARQPAAAAADVEREIELRQCEELLRPIFLAAGRLLESEDRLLLKLLLLDGVPQKDLARGLGLSSGTITRRRQRAVETILAGTRQLMAQSGRSHQADDCLELVIAGNDIELRRSLGDVLASGIRLSSVCCPAAGVDGEKPQ